MSSAEPALDSGGYGRPPRATRFAKGASGNPRGRPRGRRRSLPHDHVLGQMVTVRDQGVAKRVTAAEAFLLYLLRQGLAGDARAASDALAAIETAKGKRTVEDGITVIILKPMAMAIEGPLEDLRLAVHKYPFDEARTRWALNPWIVEAALARLGERQLTGDEQSEVWKATRTPHKVAWPNWWTARG